MHVLEPGICMNLFVGEVAGDLADISTYLLRAYPKPGAAEAAFHAALARICYRLEEQYNGVALPFGSGILMTASRTPRPVRDPAFTTGKAKAVNLADPGMEKYLERLLWRSFVGHARRQGYVRFRGVYVKATAYTGTVAGNGVPIELNRDCFGARVCVADGTVSLLMDLQSSVRQPLPLAIQHLQRTGLESAEIDKRLVGKEVITQRFGLSGVIRGFEWVPAAQYRIEELNQTLFEYWEALGEEVDREEEPTVLVFLQHRKNVVAYPPSQLNLSLRGVPIPRHEKLQIPPADRMRRLLEHSMLLQTLELGGWSVRFRPEPTSVAEMQSRGMARGSGLVDSPLLAFGGGHTGSDPRDLLRWGPSDGPCDLRVAYAASEGFDVEAIHAALDRYYSQWGFGQLEVLDTVPVLDETQKGYYRAGQAAAEAVAGQSDLSLILGLLEGSSDSYRAFKRGVDSKIGGSFRAVQMLRKGTALDIVAGKKWLAANLLSQCYAKASQRPAWTLSHPAGGTTGNAFLAFDVSRRREFQYDEKEATASVVTREASAIASVCDEYGRIIQWDTYPNHTGEILGRQEAWDILTRTFDDVRAVRGEAFRRLVVYKDGPIREGELSFVKAATEDVYREFADETGITVQVDLVSVVKSGLERVLQSEGSRFANPQRGTYVLLPGRRALLCASKPWQGTTNPIRLTYEAVVGGEWTPMDVLVREFSDLAHLDWRSLYYQPKSPLVLQLVQSLGEMLTLDIETPPYIPL